MDINSLFPSDYLKACDVAQPRVLTVKAIKLEEIGQEKTTKPVLFFQEETRGLVLNKTNGAMIAHSYGKETDKWLGKTIELHSEPVSFQSRIVDAIRVRIPAAPTAQTAAQPAASPAELINDDVDF